MSTKLHTDTKYERFKKYVHNLHTNAVNGFSKTNWVCSVNITPSNWQQDDIREGYAGDEIISAGAKIFCC